MWPPLHIHTFHLFFGSAWHLEIPTYWEWLLIDTCTTPYSYLHRAAMIAQCLIRLEARFLACLFLFSLKLECEKLVQEKTEMQRHYVMVSQIHIWSNKCKPLFFSSIPICPDDKWPNSQQKNLQQGFAPKKLWRKTVGPFSDPWIFSITRCPTAWMLRCTSRWYVLIKSFPNEIRLLENKWESHNKAGWIFSLQKLRR